MARQLSLAARPKSLDGMVGMNNIVNAIRKHMGSGRVVKAWMFAGPKGTGKTTLARILALSYQCTHQTIWGKPCKDCYQNKSAFDIHEVNASNVTGIDKLRGILEGADYGLLGDGSYRVYILDECQMMSDSAQNLLLKYLEDTPDTTVFILCSTAPHKMLDTLRSRCVVYQLRELGMDDVKFLVARLLRFVKSDLPADRLADELAECGVKSPRLICQAVEKYVAGVDPADAAQVEGVSDVDIRAMTTAVMAGQWGQVAQYLQKAQTSNIRMARLGIISYFRTVLLESPEIDSRTDAVASAVSLLCNLQEAQDLVISAALASELYKVTKLMSKYPLK